MPQEEVHRSLLGSPRAIHGLRVEERPVAMHGRTGDGEFVCSRWQERSEVKPLADGVEGLDILRRGLGRHRPNGCFARRWRWSVRWLRRTGAGSPDDPADDEKDRRDRERPVSGGPSSSLRFRCLLRTKDIHRHRRIRRDREDGLTHYDSITEYVKLASAAGTSCASRPIRSRYPDTGDPTTMPAARSIGRRSRRQQRRMKLPLGLACCSTQTGHASEECTFSRMSRPNCRSGLTPESVNPLYNRQIARVPSETDKELLFGNDDPLRRLWRG